MYRGNQSFLSLAEVTSNNLSFFIHINGVNRLEFLTLLDMGLRHPPIGFILRINGTQRLET